MKHTVLPALAGKPFVKWAGGKRGVLPQIVNALPTDFGRFTTYIEPFVGGGAVFFYLRQHYPDIKYVLNDYNSDLINAYRTVRDMPRPLIALLRDMQRCHHALPTLLKRKAYYLRQRELFNSLKPDMTERAALFIFLNKTCFNGLFRVNAAGRLNVGYGKLCQAPLICDESNIMTNHDLLKRVILMEGDYEQTEEYADRKSFYYFDPPYRPLNTTALFTSYTRQGFGDIEQIRLRQFCDRLQRLEICWMLSNSDGRNATPSNDFLDTQYEDYFISRVIALRGMKGGKNISELLITSYGRTDTGTMSRRLAGTCNN